MAQVSIFASTVGAAFKQPWGLIARARAFDSVNMRFIRESEELCERQQWHDETKRSLEREIVAAQDREQEAGLSSASLSEIASFCIHVCYHDQIHLEPACLSFLLSPNASFCTCISTRNLGEGRYHPQIRVAAIRRADRQKSSR